MITVTEKDVEHLAGLSALALSDEEVKNLRLDIENILRYISQLETLDTEGVTPSYQVTGLKNIWREDEVEVQAITSQDLLKLAPAEENNYIKVPKVL